MSSFSIDTKLNPDQLRVINAPYSEQIFLEGPAGSGKTTAGVARLLTLLNNGIRGDQVLLLIPQRTMAAPYFNALHSTLVTAGSVVDILTLGGLARRTIDLFWPLIVGRANFSDIHRQPNFLTLETAQYYMAYLVRPLLDQGAFDSVVIDRNRLYSQIIDNLNKAAVVGFPHTEIGSRLAAAWSGEPGQLMVYEDVQTCVNLFREFCLEHNLLDFSLQVELFHRYLWEDPYVRAYLIDKYKHLIYDNIEEDTPVAHDILEQWLPSMSTALFIFDTDGGYRRFLGADPVSAYRFKKVCDRRIVLRRSLVMSPFVEKLNNNLGAILSNRDTDESGINQKDLKQVLNFNYQRYYPEMLDWVAEEIDRLVHEEIYSPGEIVVLAPFMSDVLRFSLGERLNDCHVPYYTHRPSRALTDEPATRCLITLSRIAHPEWSTPPTRYDLSYAFMQAIDGMDLVRADLLSQIVYRQVEGRLLLSSFDRIQSSMQERITYLLGERYEVLRNWLENANSGINEGGVSPAFDHFLSRLFGEILAQPGYGFHADYEAGEVTANLIESIQKFRWSVGDNLDSWDVPLGREYLAMLDDGVIAAQYLRSWQIQTQDAVLLAPAYTFLMRNSPVKVQFWLDIGSRGWSERLYQPLTHPFVLSRQWPRDKTWNDFDEQEAEKMAIYSLVVGLLRRCKQELYLGLSEFNEQGYEQRGPLLQAFQRVLRIAK